MILKNLICTTAVLLNLAFWANAATSNEPPSEREMTRDEWIMLHALGDSVSSASFYDCRIELKGEEELSIERAHEHYGITFNPHHTDVRMGAGKLVVSSYRQGDDDPSWYEDQVTFVLSGNQKDIVGVSYRSLRFDHVNAGTVLAPNYQTVLTPVTQFYCQAN